MRARSLGAIWSSLTLCVALLAFYPEPAGAVAVWETVERASVSAGGGNTNGNSSEPSLSWDGRYVAFSSLASNLVSGDTNGKRDVFVRDRQTGVTTRVSTDSAGGEANGHSRQPAISGDGRFVAFVSEASNLVPGDSNFTEDVFVKDLQTGAVERVSLNSAGDEAFMASGAPAISYDGRYVTFVSLAPNLVPGDTNGTWDVFLRDRQLGATRRVSVATGGAQSNGASETPAMSYDARYVAFESKATNLDPADTSPKKDIYLRDVVAETTTRVSVPLDASSATDDESTLPAVSADGSRVVFTSLASNLDPDDVPGTFDVFVRDVGTGFTRVVTLSSTGERVEGSGGRGNFSYDAKRAAFYSSSATVVPGDSNLFSDIFVRDLETSTTAMVSVRAGQQLNDDANLPSFSGDGRFVAYSTGGVFPSSWPDNDGNEDVYLAYSGEAALTPPTPPTPLPDFPVGPPPAPPSDLTLSSLGDTTAELSWTDNSSDEVLFKVERKPVSGTFTEVGRVGANTTSFSDTGLAPGQQYIYRVRAANTEANSDYSNELTVTTTGGFPPAGPTDLAASATGPSQVQLSWTDNAVNENSYHVERRTPSTGFDEVAVLPADSQTYTDGGLSPLATYVYRVRASNSAGFSAYSNEVTVTTPAPAAPQRPTGLTVSRLGATSLELTWTDNSANEDGFGVERSTDGVSYSLVGRTGPDQARFEDVGVGGSTTYHYRVFAFNLGGESGRSEPVKTTTKPEAVCRVDALVYVSDASGNREVYIKWLDGSGTTKRVTLTGADEEEPVLDPGGNRIWFVSSETGSRKLYTVDVDGRARAVRSDDPSGAHDDTSPAVVRTPGGRTRVAFVSTRTGSPEIFVMDADGRSLARLTSIGTGQRRNPTFSPDGSWVYFASDHGAGGKYQIYRVPSAGGPVEPVAPNAAENRVDPALSPDGSLLAFVTDRGGATAEVAVRDLVGGTERVLTSGGPPIKARPRFQPDGSKLFYYGVSEAENPDVYSVVLGGGAPATAVASPAFEALGDVGPAAPWDVSPASSYLAEGATAGGFSTWLLLANPGSVPDRACVTLLTDAGPRRAGIYEVKGGSRRSIDLGSLVSTYFVGSVVESFGGSTRAERAVYSAVPGKLGSHISRGVEGPSVLWHVAEGATAGEFETWVLVANPGRLPAEARVFFLGTGGVAGQTTVFVPPGGRVSVLADSVVPDSYDVATKVVSNRPVVVERATYTSGLTRRGATASPAVPSQQKSWFVAEGATAGGFETWILVSNQGTRNACLEVTLLESTGPRVVYGGSAPPLCLGPNSRRSVNLGDFTSTYDVATKVESVTGSDGAISATSAEPVVVERAMYNDHPVLEKGSSSAEALPRKGLEWLAVEGATAGGFETWVLIANPGTSPACARVRYLTGTGAVTDPRADPICLPPGTRRSLRANDVVASYDVAASVVSVAGSSGGVTVPTPQPVVAEHSVYTAAMPVRDANSGPAWRTR